MNWIYSIKWKATSNFFRIIKIIWNYEYYFSIDIQISSKLYNFFLLYLGPASILDVLANGLLAFGDQSGNLVILNPTSGKIEQKLQLGSEISGLVQMQHSTQYGIDVNGQVAVALFGYPSFIQVWNLNIASLLSVNAKDTLSGIYVNKAQSFSQGVNVFNSLFGLAVAILFYFKF